MAFFAGDGTSFSNDSDFTNSQVFTGIRWAYGAADAITTTTRVSASWTSGIDGTPFAQNTNYTVQIFGNNSAGALEYSKSGDNTLAANTWELWINGVKVQTGIGKAALAHTINIDSFMFIGSSSTGNVAQLTLDNIQ